MAQVTIYLDGDTEELVKRYAKAKGISVSRWVADVVRAQAADEWPPGLLASFRSWKDSEEP